MDKLLFFFAFLLAQSIWAQPVDSLRSLLKNTTNEVEKIQLHIQLANALIQTDRTSALRYAQMAEDAAMKINDLPLVAKSCAIVGRIYHMESKYDSAAICYTNALNIAEDDKVRATLYNNLGALHRRLGNYEEAQSNYLSSLDLLEKVGDSLSIGRNYFNLGILNSTVGKYKEAKQFYLKNLRIAESLGDSLWLSTSHRGLGDVNWYLKDYEAARIAYSNALRYLQKGQEYRLESILIGIGNCMAVEGEFYEAEKQYVEAMKIAKGKNDMPSIAQGYINLGTIRDSLGFRGQAISDFKSALEIAEEIGLREHAANAAGGLAYIYSKSGNFSKAYKYVVQYHALKDSMLNAENLRQISELQLKYDNEKANSEINRLEAENVKQEVNLERQKTLVNRLVFGGMFILLLLAFAYAYYRYWRQKKDLAIEKEHRAEVEKLLFASQKFVPQKFLEGIGRNELAGVALGDQKKTNGTILFSDIRSYTSLAEQMSPQDLFDFLNAFLGRMGPVITNHKGFVNQFTGDGIMAIFLESADDALRAATSMQLTLQAYNEKRVSVGRFPIKIGIGMHTGEMMLGVIGYGERFDTGIVSDTVNVSSRIEGLTKFFGGQIIFSEATYKQLKNKEEFNIRHIGKVQVKGRKKAMKIYECFDGDSMGAVGKKQATYSLFEKGVEKYYAKDFTEAAALFHEVVEKNENDRVATFLLQEAVRLSAKGVDEGWEGVIKMEVK